MVQCCNARAAATLPYAVRHPNVPLDATMTTESASAAASSSRILSAPDYRVGLAVDTDWRRPVVAVDGEVRGADIHYDHHQTRERLNIDTLPHDITMPGTICTPMIDSDSIISAACILLRAAGQHAEEDAARPVLIEAAHYCDYLIPTGSQDRDTEQHGLGLHCWLKGRGFDLVEVLAWERGEIAERNGSWHPQPSAATRSSTFESLVGALANQIRVGQLAADTRWLDRIAEMAAMAEDAVTRRYGTVAHVRLKAYVDPIALYQAIDADVVVQERILADDRYAYTIGLNPRAYGRRDLLGLAAILGARDPGWGGRSNAIGSPRGVGSALTTDVVADILRDWLSSLPTRRAG